MNIKDVITLVAAAIIGYEFAEWKNRREDKNE